MGLMMLGRQKYAQPELSVFEVELANEMLTFLGILH